MLEAQAKRLSVETNEPGIPNEVIAIKDLDQEVDGQDTDDAPDPTKKKNGSSTGSGKLPLGKFGLRQKSGAKVGPE